MTRNAGHIDLAVALVEGSATLSAVHPTSELIPRSCRLGVAVTSLVLMEGIGAVGHVGYGLGAGWVVANLAAVVVPGQLVAVVLVLILLPHGVQGLVLVDGKLVTNLVNNLISRRVGVPALEGVAGICVGAVHNLDLSALVVLGRSAIGVAPVHIGQGDLFRNRALVGQGKGTLIAGASNGNKSLIRRLAWIGIPIVSWLIMVTGPRIIPIYGDLFLRHSVVQCAICVILVDNRDIGAAGRIAATTGGVYHVLVSSASSCV